MEQQHGFTLVELVVVILILGLLAAVAAPKFVNLNDSAAGATTESVAGALSSASMLNHSNNLADDSGITITSPLVAIATCEAVAGLLKGGLDADYSITAGTGTVISGGGVGSEGGTSTCTVSHTQGSSASFTAYGVAP